MIWSCDFNRLKVTVSTIIRPRQPHRTSCPLPAIETGAQYRRCPAQQRREPERDEHECERGQWHHRAYRYRHHANVRPARRLGAKYGEPAECRTERGDGTARAYTLVDDAVDETNDRQTHPTQPHRCKCADRADDCNARHVSQRDHFTGLRLSVALVALAGGPHSNAEISAAEAYRVPRRRDDRCISDSTDCHSDRPGTSPTHAPPVPSPRPFSSSDHNALSRLMESGCRFHPEREYEAPRTQEYEVDDRCW